MQVGSVVEQLSCAVASADCERLLHGSLLNDNTVSVLLPATAALLANQQTRRPSVRSNPIYTIYVCLLGP